MKKIGQAFLVVLIATSFLYASNKNATKTDSPITEAINSNIVSLYLGGMFSHLGGSVSNTQSIQTQTTSKQIGFGSAVYLSATTTSSTVNHVLTSTNNTYGGEAHVGMQINMTKRFDFAMELYSNTQDSFHVNYADYTLLIPNSSQATVPGTNTYSNAIQTGLNVGPTGLSYGFRLKPIAKISSQFSLYTALGYGNQSIKGTLQNYTTQTENFYSKLGLQLPTNNIDATQYYHSYGAGTYYTFNDKVRMHTGIEIKKFNAYDTTNLNTEYHSYQSASTGFVISPGSQITTLYTITMSDISPITEPSSLKFNIYTFSMGLDYIIV